MGALDEQDGRPWSRTNLLIRAAAERLGVEAGPIASVHSDFFMRLRWADAPEGPRERIISKTRSPYLSQVAQTLSNNKFIARELLAAAGLPVVESALFDEADDPRVHAQARARAQAMLAAHAQVVVKPNWGNRGVGVSTGIRDLAGLLAAYEHAVEVDRDEEVLVEPELGGLNLRVSVIGGEVCGVAELRRAWLVGDGQRPVSALLAALNDDPRRGRWDQPALVSLDQITAESIVDRLAVLGLDLDAVLAAGAEVELCTDEVEVVDRTDELDPRWAAIAARAAAVLGVDVAGVDLLGPAHDLLVDAPGEPTPASAAIMEVNVLPGLHLHALPTIGRPRPVFEAFVRYCLQLPGAPPIPSR